MGVRPKIGCVLSNRNFNLLCFELVAQAAIGVAP